VSVEKEMPVSSGIPAHGDDLPPSSSGWLAAWGWLLLGLSVAVAVFLARYSIPALGFYGLFVLAGFVVALPGDQFYKMDIERYHAAHPELDATALPWPSSYAALRPALARKYTRRGLPGALRYALLMPVLLVLGGLCDVGLLPVRAVESIYRRGPAGH
jgi:hypothetical protein